MTRAASLLLFTLATACGGGSTPTQPTQTSSARPVRVEAAPEEPSAEGPRPIRVEATAPGEVAETDELAAPPPVEAPTSHL